MATIREIIDNKIHEVFCEYQQTHNITNGDIEPLDWARLEICKDELADHIQRICDKQPRAINYDDFTPSWYIYTDCEGEPHVQTFGGCTADQFFTAVSKRICFDDLTDETVQKIFYKGKEVKYAGWQPGMKFEYTDLDGNTVWVGYFEHWDH